MNWPKFVRFVRATESGSLKSDASPSDRCNFDVNALDEQARPHRLVT
jgi:hypothetical protein